MDDSELVVGAGDIPRLSSQVRRATRTPEPKIQVSITTVVSQFLYLAHVGGACVYGSEKQTRPMSRLKGTNEELGITSTEVGQIVYEALLPGSTRNRPKVIALCHKYRM